MCGIAGFAGAGDASILEAMADALVHRGPDGAGYHVDTERAVHLAHRRLAILDIAGGTQPMWNEDGGIGVVFNGEIYNHAELRKDLIAAGHRFRSDHSDTEVLVHGYEEWGDELPVRLNGMFAFAIFDKPRGRLFLARDRFGEKPLYYAAGATAFVFASELTALRRHPGVSGSIDPAVLAKYFAYGFIPAPNALYKGVRKLPAGWRLTCEVATLDVRLDCYWSFRIEPQQAIPRDAEQTWCEELRALLAQAVRRRLISDVPLGVFLSGGIDSSAVLAYADAAMEGRRPSTYSIGFREASFDESAYARQVAETFRSSHHEDVLDLDKAQELAPAILSRLDEPMADGSLVPTYLLCRFARQEVTVALGGDGGDELFAGYDPFKALGAARLYQRFVPRWAHRGLRALADLVPASERNMSLDFKIKRTLRGLSYPESLWNPVWLSALEPAEISDLLRTPVHVEDLYAEALTAWHDSTADNPVDKTLEFYTRFYLQDDILTKVDRASMMVSLEVRAPFLDNDLVDFARRLPHQYKFRQGTTKYLLKKALEPVLPHDIIYRKKKGFGVPLAQWLKRWDSPASALRGVDIDRDVVDDAWHSHRAGQTDQRLFLWSLRVLDAHTR